MNNMKISRLKIQNFRNIRNVEVQLGTVVALIGENNSGKSNFLYALTLPFLSDESAINKNLSWTDINAEAKADYYQFILRHKDEIIADTITLEAFASALPVVSVEVDLAPKDDEFYFVKDICYSADTPNGMLYGLKYEYKVSHPEDLLAHVRSILASEQIDEESIDNVKMNLLPTSMFTYSILVPQKNSKVMHDALRRFKYTALTAERDNFSNSNERIGSKSLVKLLQMKLGPNDLLTVEKEYSRFFDALKSLSGMDNIINWQNSSEIPNAKDFFDNIDILPNMPPMTSILSSVRLGYSGENLSSQGLGQRNLILLLVLLNSLLDKSDDIVFRVLTVEEPEAHLCINNIHLIASFIKAFTKDNQGIQLFYSTHNTELVNKLDLKNVVVLSDGKAFSLTTELQEEEREYLSKNPNADLFKLFFSKRCILVEGLTEELLIKAYLNSKPDLSDIDVISFHKGFTKIIDIWVSINQGTTRRLGIVRDFDDQPAAQQEHEKYNSYPNICVQTTKEYTLEPEIVKAGDNYNLLKDKYGAEYGWTGLTQDQLADDWRTTKSSVMLRLCHDLSRGELSSFVMPQHIQSILDFMTAKEVETAVEQPDED